VQILRHRAVFAALGLALVTTAAACGGGGDESAETTVTTGADTTAGESSTTRATTTTAPTTTTTTGPVSQLTGLPVDDVLVTLRPALVVKIDNHPNADPQTGLAIADVVFEEQVEGISRFAAVFHSASSNPVGPVRSGRTSDIDIVAQLGRPLFAWSGGNRGVTSAINNANLLDVGYALKSVEGGWFRERTRRSPHNLYAQGDLLFAQAEPGQPAPPQLFQFLSAGEDFPGRPVPGVSLDFDGVTPEFRWEAARNGWARSQYGDPHVDLNTGEQHAPTNVVVLFCEYRRSPADPRSPEAVTVGEGTAWVFSQGEVIEGRWVRPDATQPAQLLDGNGNVIELTPGRTWVELPRTDSAALLTE
jgi:hypothetical protein